MNRFARIVRKTFIGVSLLAVTVGIIGAGGVACVFWRAQPDYAGQQKVTGLSDAVRVYRDAYGVPHIFAANDKDAARTLGYVHASERLFQMEMQRRAGQGRLSEIIGSETAGIDRFVRTLGLYGLAQSSFSAMSPEAQGVFQSYADGVNAWLSTHQNSLPPEFLILHDTPEPWQPADSVVWGKLMALQLSHNYRLELLRAELQSEFSATQLGWLFPMPPVGTPVTTTPVALPFGESHHAALPAQEQLAMLLGIDHAASNEWVIGGSLTESGKPILANDPHLGLEAPILWYLARIVTPQGSVKGATVPGLPIVVLGQTDHLAWGFTTTGSDTQDLFVETIDPANSKNYLTPSGSEPFITRDEAIRIKGRADAHVTVRSTRHGPILSDIDGEMLQLAGDGKVMALAFTGLGAQDTTAEALLKINHAQSAADLFEALKLYQTPTQNVVYADSEGAFGFINPGFVPIRKKGEGLVPVDGASGDNDWNGFVPFDSLPQIANPAAGYVFNTNNEVVAANPALFFGRDWEESFRARRLQQLFDATTGKFTVARSAEMQADHLSLAAQELLPLLLAVTPTNTRAKQALAMLRSWNGVMDKDRAEPAIFDAWLYKFHRHMLPLKTNVNMNEKGPFAAEALLPLIKEHAGEWCALPETPGGPLLPPDPDCHALMAQSLDEALAMETQNQGEDMNAWRWGHENVAALHHKFYNHVPLLKKWSDLSIESSGDFYTIDRGGSFNVDPQHPLQRMHGGGYRGIYDLSNPDASLFVIATGESGHIFSPHYGDQVKMWNDVKAITLSGSEDQLRKRGLSMLELEP